MDHFSFLLNIDFSFAPLKTLGKTPRENDRLQSAVIGCQYTRMSASSFKNLSESWSTPEAVEILISCMIFNIFLVVTFRQMSALITKLE